MRRVKSWFHPSAGLALAACLWAVGSPLAAQTSSGTYAPVTLELASGSGAVGNGSECASVDPDSVEIYTHTLDPRAVEWTVLNKDSGHAWKMEYASDKPGASAPGFGSEYWIPCGPTDSVQSALASQAGRWIYRVKVFECVDGEPSGDPICTVDPEVALKEPPP